MRKKVETFIREQGLFGRGAQVLIGVSGGADSVCLLYVLAGLRKDWGLTLKAVHVNHGLRGEEADRDEAFTARLCESLAVPAICKRIDVAAAGKELGLSGEEAARRLRYRAMEEEAGEWEKESGKEVKIAVAHHRDDQAETVLHNLFRGSGLKGLGGIRPARGRLVRPLLGVGRKEILNFLEEEGASYCQDSTNCQDCYTRNKIRLNILPAVCSQVNGRATEHILQAAKRIGQADEYLESQAGKWFGQYGRADEQAQWAEADIAALSREPEIIQTYVIRLMIMRLSGPGKDITGVHVEDVRGLMAKQTGRRVNLPYGITARRIYGSLRTEREKKEKSFPDLERLLEFQVFPFEKGAEIPQKRYTKWFDYDKIKDGLSVRTRQAGDYFILPGGGRKTLKAYLTDEKVPAEERGTIPLLAEGSHILWIVGRRISEAYKVTTQTKRILQVHVSGGRENGGQDSGSVK